MFAAVSTFRVLRQVFKGSKIIAHLCDILDHDKHPHVYHAYYCTAIVVYVTHISVSLAHGIEVETSVTAAATTIELIAHIIGG